MRVRILDENDNAPLFTQRNYGAVLLQASTIKDSVINVSDFSLQITLIFASFLAHFFCFS